eukprot:SAG31_NODE_1190_length_9465_cov_4.082746_4_plen_160_part_00
MPTVCSRRSRALTRQCDSLSQQVWQPNSSATDRILFRSLEVRTLCSPLMCHRRYITNSKHRTTTGFSRYIVSIKDDPSSSPFDLGVDDVVDVPLGDSGVVESDCCNSASGYARVNMKPTTTRLIATSTVSPNARAGVSGLTRAAQAATARVQALPSTAA